MYNTIQLQQNWKIVQISPTEIST